MAVSTGNQLHMRIDQISKYIEDNWIQGSRWWKKVINMNR